MAHIDVVVSGVNEHAPVFSQSLYNVTISENTPIGTSVLDIDAADGDHGIQGQLSYSLSSTSMFYIDQNSGVLVLNKNLDYEATTSYSLKVTVTDGDTTSPKSSYVNVTVYVRDENDNKPTFNPTVYTVSIAENTTVGEAILSLTCTDADSGTNGAINMAIISGNTNTGFSISDAGVISVATPLDLETTQTYSLVVTATDQNAISPLSSTAYVTIEITDINEHAPVFTNGGSYTAVVSEEATIGHYVTNVSASDNDYGAAYGSVTYSIISGNSENKFYIRPLDGKVFVQTSLDRETTSSYTLKINATDQDLVSPKSSTASLLITISDVNDNSPACDPFIYSKSLDEGVTTGTTVVQISCTDNDVSPNGIALYTIDTGNTTLFQVSSSGLVTTKGLFNYESVKSYVLVINVTDGGVIVRTSQVTVSVEITGINEYPPVFGQEIYNVSYLESINIGSVIATPAATDEDDGKDGDITFFIDGGNEDDRFLIDSHSGKIELKRPLDRENIHFYNITIGARDDGSPNKSSYARVLVEVQDVNDNAPNCSQTSYVIKIAENKTVGSSVVGLLCDDQDDGSNGVISYNITAGNTNSDFAINSSTGVLSLARSLDRETTKYYDLIVTVSDNGSPKLTTKINLGIAVTPINEFKPNFTKGFYSVVLNEDVAIGTTVLTLTAHDSDSDSQGDITFKILDGNQADMFLIGVNTGEILLKKRLDYELQSAYSLLIRATDGASANLIKHSDVRVNFTIIDINDNSPSCVDRYKLITLLESTIKGTLIFKTNCTDSDSSGNSLLSYDIITGNEEGIFNVTSSGDVMTIKGLDSERSSMYNLVVMVKDTGNPPLSCNITLTVCVQPVNEFVPTFASGDLYHLDVRENITLGTVIFKAKVQDNDTGLDGTLSFSMLNNSLYDKFYLDAVDGRLILIASLDREQQDNYNITIKVHDGRAKQSSVTVYIKVIDVNDNAPVCTSTLYSLEIPETIAVGSNITTFTCTDQDSGLNSQLTYTFGSGNTGNHFKLDNNTLVVAKQLDHETTDEYSLAVKVTDGGIPAQVTDVMVTVVVIAKNEHIPKFENASYTVNISEWTAIGHSVFDVNATDDDKGIHGNLEYYITSGLNGSIDFTIDKITGTVRVGSKLDRETRDTYVLNITAKDKGITEHETLSRTVLLTIGITDENDNPPLFTEVIYTTTIPENIPIGNSVVMVITTDADIGINADHTYTITGGDGLGKFSINQTSGTIGALAGLDYETKSTYYLSVIARDHGVPQRHALSGVRIFLSDVNDNKPVFKPTLYITSILETTSAGSDVIPVYASDPDSGINAEILFTIAGGDPKDQFNVIENGTIRTKRTLSSYSLIIRASDKGSPVLSETVSVQITIEDVNDNAPIFGSSAYSVSVPEDAPIGTRFLNISATDADVDLNAKLTYSIVSGNVGNKISIDESTGILATIGTFDREKLPSYQLTIKAQDAGIPSKYSTTNVEVRIIDRNDNSPSFTRADYSFAVTENQPSGLLVGVVKATDIDNGTHAQLVYSIEPTSHSNHFSINPLSGVIYTAMALDREAVASYALKVKVSDSASYPNQLYNTTTVSISVLDVNDNPPVFTKNKDNVSIAENSPSGTLVTRVTATDTDRDANARVSYTLAHTNISDDYFRIDSITGEIFVKNVFDYENIQNVTLTLTARDDGLPPLSGSMRLRVDLIDVNDNAPKMSLELYDAEIRSDRALGLPAILTVSATDEDSERNGRVSYELENQQKIFSLDTVTGVIVLEASPGNGKTYTFRVRAKDDGVIPLTSSYSTVRIDTIDAEQTMVDITLDITQEEFEANKEYFLKKLSAMLGADVKIAEIQQQEVEKKRRKRETKKGIKITFYAVKKPSTNTTDVQTKLKDVKKFLSRDEIMSVLLDKDGNLNPELTNSTELGDFKITKVSATKPTIPPEPTFMEKLEGIVTVTVSSLAVVVILVAILCIRKQYKKRELREQRREPRLRPKKGIVDADFEVYKPKISHNKIMPLSPTETYIGKGYNARRFDGKAVDPVSGRVYAFNKVTGERRWLHEDYSISRVPQRKHHNEANRSYYEDIDLPGAPQ